VELSFLEVPIAGGGLFLWQVLGVLRGPARLLLLLHRRPRSLAKTIAAVPNQGMNPPAGGLS